MRWQYQTKNYDVTDTEAARDYLNPLWDFVEFSNGNFKNY